METLEKIKAERDELKWFVDKLDSRIVVSTIHNGKYKYKTYQEIMYFIKGQLFDLKYRLDSIRKGDFPVPQSMDCNSSSTIISS